MQSRHKNINAMQNGHKKQQTTRQLARSLSQVVACPCADGKHEYE
jgi:hypothetical protein